MPRIYTDAELMETIRPLMQPFLAPHPRRCWAELVLCGATAWLLAIVALAFVIPHHPAAGLLLLLASTPVFFRALLFLHETYHARSRALRGFWLAYDLLVGFVFLLPSYCNATHVLHHSKPTYGTVDDPEYDAWAGRGWPAFIIAPLMMTVMPILHLLRFGVVTPLMPFIGKRARRWIYARASTLSMHFQFVRPAPDRAERIRWAVEDVGCCLTWWAIFALVITGLCPWLLIAEIYLLIVTVYILNFFRAIVSHRYASGLTPSTIQEQMLDSVTIESRSPIVELLFPLGLRYHTLHHLMPGIPYSALGQAHQALVAALPADHPYRQTVVRGYLAAWRHLLSATALSAHPAPTAADHLDVPVSRADLA